MSARRIAIVVVLLAVALALRIGEVQRTSYRPTGDAVAYLKLGGEVSRTGDYSSRDPGAGGSRGPSAYFPPGYPYLVAGVDLVIGRSVEAQRLASAVAGTVIVGLVGLLASEALGPTIGLVALALAAVYPVLIELSALLVAENLFTALVLAAVFMALRAQRGRRPIAHIAGAGILGGLATLTHTNGVVLVLPLAVAAWLAAGRSVKGPLVLVLAGVATVAPWTIRNAAVLHHFVPVGDETGITLVGTYNPRSAQHDYRWHLYLPVHRPGRLTEPQLSSRLTTDAFDYIGRHPAAPLAAAYDNLRRMLEIAGSSAWHASADSIDLPLATARIGVVAFWVLCALALAGALTKPVREAPRWIWLAPLLLTVSIVLVNAETPRFREPIDPFLILPAALAVAAVAGRAAGRLRGTPVRRVRRPPLAAGGAQLVEVRERLA